MVTYCITSLTLSNGGHPFVIRICKGEKKYQSLGVSVLSQFWNFKVKTRDNIDQAVQINKGYYSNTELLIQAYKNTGHFNIWCWSI
ncbi:MAG: Arm DNA-binding domain-containing protein [Dysgonomonas sp.]